MNGNDNNKSALESQLSQYVDTYDEISKFLETETSHTKRMMAVAHRKWVLDMMLTLRLALKYPQTA